MGMTEANSRSAALDWPESGAAAFDGETWHGRKDGPANAFAYRVDYVLLRLAPGPARTPWPVGRFRFSPLAYSDRDHGDGRGPAVEWARRLAAAQGLPDAAMHEVWLLTQPRRFGYVFNPVSFWFFRDAEGVVRAALAEVNNTFGDRHAYFCAVDGFEAIDDGAEIVRPKRMHVSPFQAVAGDYAFRFRIVRGRISIAIDHRNGEGGMRATLVGKLSPLNAAAAMRLLCRRPLGAARVFLLIHWQAIKLALKGAAFRRRPVPIKEEVTG